MISFLHTSEIHIERFEKLVRKFDSKTPIKHYINTDILTFALEKNTLDVNGFKKEIETIKKEQPSTIICTCSTYGALCDELDDIKRIDYPIAKYIVSTHSKIAIAYTASSTALVSKTLIEQEAVKQQKVISILECDCTSAWQYFNNGLDDYENEIAKKLNKLNSSIDCVFLAQASMEGVVNYVDIEKIKIYSSPEFGIQSYLKKLELIN